MANLELYKTQIKEKAEVLIQNVMPQKIVYLNKLLTNTIPVQNLVKFSSEIHIPLSAPSVVSLSIEDRKRLHREIRKHSYHNHNQHGHKLHLKASTSCRTYESVSQQDVAIIPTNKHLLNLIGLTKPHVKDILTHIDTLKMWVCLNIPKVEAGNNSGVAVQEMVLEKIYLLEKFAILLFNYTSLCFIARGEIISKVATFPDVNDYKKAIIECDENNYRYFMKMISQIRDLYCSLHDTMAKNLDKIKNPRVNNKDCLCV